jgi:hypothetical protein
MAWGRLRPLLLVRRGWLRRALIWARYLSWANTFIRRGFSFRSWTGFGSAASLSAGSFANVARTGGLLFVGSCLTQTVLSSLNLLLGSVSAPTMRLRAAGASRGS